MEIGKRRRFKPIWLSLFTAMIENSLKDFNMYALKPDLEARGLSLDNVIEGVKIVGYEEFVDLTTEHDSVQSWL